MRDYDDSIGADGGEAVSGTVFADGPRPRCPLGFSGACTCQTAFEYAYARYGYPSSYSRAVLLAATAAPVVRVPRIVSPWIRSLPAAAPSERCIGCSLTPQGAREMRATYRDTIHRDVTAATVAEHAVSDCPPSYIGIQEPPRELSESERVLHGLIGSGALLDDDIDGLGGLARGAA